MPKSKRRAFVRDQVKRYVRLPLVTASLECDEFGEPQQLQQQSDPELKQEPVPKQESEQKEVPEPKEESGLEQLAPEN